MKKQYLSSTLISSGYTPPPLCYTTANARRVLDIGKTKLYELIASGDLVAIKIGRRTLIEVESVFRLVDSAPRLGNGKGDSPSPGPQVPEKICSAAETKSVPPPTLRKSGQ